MVVVAGIDQNSRQTLLGLSSANDGTFVIPYVDPITHRLLTDIAGGGSGTVTDVSVVTANGFAGSVATSTTTPAITLSTTINSPVLAGNGTALIAATTTGSGSTVVLSTSPTFATSITGSYLTASEILITDGSKNIVSAPVATYPSLTELSYVKGVTSAIQTQLNGKQATITPAALTRTDDTNVTLTLGGTPNTALLQATSITAGWTGNLAVSRGGTGGGSASITLFNNITGYTASGATGTTSTNLVFSTSPVLTTPTLGVASATTINKVTITAPASSATLTISDGKTLTQTHSITHSGTDSTTMTYPTTSATLARTDAGQTFTGVQTTTQVLSTNNAIAASGNAATVPVTSKINTVTNNSAATLTITLTTAGAIDRQQVIVCVLDSSAAAQTITWVNTENSTVSAPTTSNGSTTLPVTVGFMYNAATSKWRTIASA